MIDPIDRVKVLMDRAVTCDHLRSTGLAQPSFLVVHAHAELSPAVLSKHQLHFPLVAKPLVAHGPSAHRMCLVFNYAGLANIQTPCVLQQYINHRGVMYKVFANISSHVDLMFFNELTYSPTVPTDLCC